MKEVKTKVLIIGSGPAGCSAAIYSARASRDPVMVMGMSPGGQLTVTTDVENYPGFADVVQGPWLMEQMMKQAEHVGTKIIYDYIEKVDFASKPFKAYGSSTVYVSDSVIISTGAEAKWLGLESEKKFQGFGVSGCATCDGFFFKNKQVLVVGGGNTAVEEALYLTNHASKVTVIHRRDSFRAEKILQERLFKNPKISVVWDHELEEVLGTESPTKSVTGARIKNTKTGDISTILAEGIFIAIGHKPNTDIFKGQLDLDSEGYIITNPNSIPHGSTTTSIPGIFAAGDVQDKVFRQAVTAAGTGCMAALEVEKYLGNQE